MYGLLFKSDFKKHIIIAKELKFVDCVLVKVAFILMFCLSNGYMDHTTLQKVLVFTAQARDTPSIRPLARRINRISGPWCPELNIFSVSVVQRDKSNILLNMVILHDFVMIN